MNELTFRVDAVTEAAGKYNPNAVRNGNEDNVYVDVDLTGRGGASVHPGDLVNLGSLGMLMVVADGMGGMNAGEVASQIAVDTVRQMFSPGVLPAESASSPEFREKYLENVILRADTNIKADAARNSSRNGMGSTIIIAWLMPNGSLTLSWIGDSRAYAYNKTMGLHIISEDHSYVQQLVNNGLITYEQSFDHPQNNVILKSLGDPSQPAQAETRHFHVGAGDTILLCSDGLSGVVRDRSGIDPLTGNPYKEEAIEDIVKAHRGDVVATRKALWSAAERGGWYDNVSIIICSIEKGPSSKIASEITKIEKANAKAIASKRKSPGGETSKGKNKTLLYAIIALLIIALGGVAGYLLTLGDKEADKPTVPVEQSAVVGSEDVELEEPEAPARNSVPSVKTTSQSSPSATKETQKQPTPKAANPAVQKAANAVVGEKERTTTGTQTSRPIKNPLRADESSTTLNKNEKSGGGSFQNESSGKPDKTDK